MLVLSRKVGEQVVLPLHHISIQVQRIGRAQVQIGIEAPEYVRIVRGELVRAPPPSAGRCSKKRQEGHSDS